MSAESKLTLDSFVFEDGHRLEGVQIGYRAWGELDRSQSNAILVCHGFPAHSNAAGEWWPWLIGPGKVLNTEKYFVICVSSFANLTSGSSVKSTGPASLNPCTNVPYDGTFPTLSMLDLVSAQNEVLKHLDIQRLLLAIGPSMGAAQVLTRACNFPKSVAAVAAILPFCGSDIVAELSIRAWSEPLKLEKVPTETALVQAFVAMASDAVGAGALNTQFASADEALSALLGVSQKRAAVSHPLHFIRLCDALAAARLTPPPKDEKLPPILLAPASSDRLFPPSVADNLGRQLDQFGFPIKQVLLESDRGHLAGLTDHVLRLEPAIADSLCDAKSNI